MFYRGVMPGFGSPDEVGIGDVSQSSEVLHHPSEPLDRWLALTVRVNSASTYSESLADPITKLLLAHSARLGRLLDFQTMLVGAGRENYLPFRVSEAGEASENVGEEEGVEVAYMRS
jgi:hypothetical protein